MNPSTLSWIDVTGLENADEHAGDEAWQSTSAG
jgi:hypothetical protein